jgi:hypothetical protein
MHKILCLVLAIAILASGCSMSLQGDNGLEVFGDSDTKTVTLALDGTVVRGVLADSGNATALNNWLTLAGGGNVTVSASGNTVTITCVSGNSSSGSLPGLLPGHLFIGNESGLPEDMELTGDATLNSLGELSVGWADMCQLADTANTAGDSDTLDGQHSSAFVTTRLTSKVIAFSRELSAASGDISYTGVGFTPTSLVVSFSCLSAGSEYYTGSGMSDSAKNVACVSRFSGASYNLIQMSPTSHYSQTATVKSYDANGFTLTWTRGGSTLSDTLSCLVICYR